MNRLRAAGLHVTTAALAVLFLLPLLWTLYSSVTGREAANGGFGTDNYRRLADYGSGLGTYLVNTTVVALVAVAVTVVTTTLGGYAMARLAFPGRNVLFLVTLAILMVPYTTILVPLYILLGWLGLQNSLIGLGLVMAVLQLPFGLFMMRNSFEALPVELEEAALIDGCSIGGALRRVLLRGVAPAWSPSPSSRSSRPGTSSSHRSSSSPTARSSPCRSRCSTSSPAASARSTSGPCKRVWWSPPAVRGGLPRPAAVLRPRLQLGALKG